MKDFQKGTDQTVPSQEQPSKASSNENTQSEEQSSYPLSDLNYGDPSNTKEGMTNYLLAVAEAESGSKLSKESARILENFVTSSSKGYAGSLPMKCAGEECPFLSACPLHQSGSALPVGKACPVEKTIVARWVNKHLDALGIKDPEDPAHSFDMDLLYELAAKQLLQWRCSVHISDDPSLVSTKQIAATPQGEAIFADVINPVLDIMERLGRDINKIREALIATRESQVKAGQSAMDPSQAQAELRKKADDLFQYRLAYLNSINKEEVKEAEFEVKKNETETD